MLGGVKLNRPTAIITAGVGIVASVCIAIRVTGMRPLGEAEMLAQIEREDTQLCEKFGMSVEAVKLSDCLSDLADLRNHHMQLVASYDLP